MRDQQAHWLAGIGGYLVGLQKYTWLVCRNTPAGFDKDQHAEEAHDASMHLLSWSGHEQQSNSTEDSFMRACGPDGPCIGRTRKIQPSHQDKSVIGIRIRHEDFD